MKWLWFAGPLVFLVAYLAVVLGSTAEDRRWRREIERWLEDFLGPLKIGKKIQSRRVRGIPAALTDILERVGGGARVADVALVPKLAYVALRAANGLEGSSHQTVLCKLSKPGPAFTARPLPVVDGRPVENKGVSFKGDDAFMESFIVEGHDVAAIRKWLGPSLREVLLDLPEAWLRVEGRTMALTLYGHADADRLDELLGVADALFAERGAGGDSLFGPPVAGKGKKLEKAPSPGYRDAKHRPRGERRDEARPEELAPSALRLKAGAMDVLLYAAAAFLVAAVVGAFHSWHPLVLFNNPDPVVSQPWQGGWSTKGVGAFVAAETLLVGLFVWQSYLGAVHGRSLGKLLFGLRVVKVDGGPVRFMSGLLRRTWPYGVVPLIVAAALARPFGWRAFFDKIPTLVPLAAGGVMLLLAAAATMSIKDGQALHDRLAGTKVVRAERWRVAQIQLAPGAGLDPLVFKQVLRVTAILVLFVVANLVAYQTKGLWLYELLLDAPAKALRSG